MPYYVAVKMRLEMGKRVVIPRKTAALNGSPIEP
jgi:hypothetical protein